MAFTLDTTYTLYIENPEAAGTTLRVGNAGYTVTREGEEGSYSFSIALTSTGEVLYSGVKKIGLDQMSGYLYNPRELECRIITFLEKGGFHTVYCNRSGSTALNTINDSIERVEDEWGKIKNISNNVFRNCKALKVVIMPQLKSIAAYSFYNCSALTDFSLPDRIEYIDKYALYGTQLRYVTIPNTVSYINEYAMYKTPLEEIVIPNCVKRIGTAAFVTTTLKKVIVEKGGGSISLDGNVVGTTNYTPFFRIGGLYDNSQDNDIVNELILMRTVSDTCRGATRLQKVTFGDNIAKEFCKNCRALRTVLITSDAKTIENSAFMNCSSLMSLTFESLLTTIGADVFNGCISLSDFTLPKTVSSIGEHAFNGVDCVITCTSAQAEMITASGGFEGTFNIVDD